MITYKKVQIFDRYNGDNDDWARSGSRKEKLIIEDSDWYLISDILQDLLLVKKGLASPELISSLQNKLNTNCDNEETISYLKKIAEKGNV